MVLGLIVGLGFFAEIMARPTDRFRDARILSNKSTVYDKYEMQRYTDKSKILFIRDAALLSPRRVTRWPTPEVDRIASAILDDEIRSESSEVVDNDRPSTVSALHLRICRRKRWIVDFRFANTNCSHQVDFGRCGGACGSREGPEFEDVAPRRKSVFELNGRSSTIFFFPKVTKCRSCRATMAIERLVLSCRVSGRRLLKEIIQVEVTKTCQCKRCLPVSDVDAH